MFEFSYRFSGSNLRHSEGHCLRLLSHEIGFPRRCTVAWFGYHYFILALSHEQGTLWCAVRYLKLNFNTLASQKICHTCSQMQITMNSSLLHFLKVGFPAEWDPSSCTHATMWFLVPKWVCRGRYNTILPLLKIEKNSVSHL